MEVGEARVIPVTESSQVGEARRAAVLMAREMGFDQEDSGRVGLVVTEAAANLAKHARAGRLLLQEANGDGRRGMVAMAIDQGPGLERVSNYLKDGYSTAGSPGTGLGAMARQSDAFDIHSELGKGTGVFMAIWSHDAGKAGAPAQVGGLSVALAGEFTCGDSWAHVEARGRRMIMVSDGLGHGAAAHEASQVARRIFLHDPGLATTEIVQRMHDAMKKTRGAAVAVCALDANRGVVRFCGVGNIRGRIIDGDSTRGLVSHHGTVGSDVRKIQEFSYPWTPGSLLVLASDGLAVHWDLSDQPGLSQRRPGLIAGILFRDHARERDDVTVVVARNEP